MKQEKKLIFSLPILLYVLIYFTIIVRFLPRIASLLSCIFIAVLTFINYKKYSLPRKETKKKIDKKCTKYVVISLLIYITLIFMLGLITGYRLSAYSHSIIKIIRNTIFPFISITLLEIYRYISINNYKDEKKVFIETILIIMFDVVINFYRLDGTLVDLFIFSSVVVLPLILKNTLLNYISKNVGFKQCLIYVIPLGLYKYFVPVYPNLGNYLTCIVGITLPAMLYIHLNRMVVEESKVEQLEEDTKDNKKIKKTIRIITEVILIFVFTIFITLISSQFPYQLIGVESSKISPIIKRGDAVLIYKNISYDDYDTGNIIAYKSGKKIIIDIVGKVEQDEIGEHHIYVKKEIKDGKVSKYKEITEEEIIGIYKNVKIRKVAYPTIKFKEIIKGDVNEEK